VPVTLDASSSSDPDGTLVRYTFSAGDGSPPVAGASSQVTHTYTAPGTYTAQVQVEDDAGGTAVATCDIAVQEAACVPENSTTFCVRLARNCGRVYGLDNCGTPRTVPDCGSCWWPETCGGGVTDGACAQGCGYDCPMGFSCAGQDGCGGGDYNQVRMDVRTHTVSGSITLNGATPTTTCSGSTTPKATITLLSTRNGTAISRDLFCNAANFNFSLDLPRDVYRVTVVGRHATNPGDRTNLPSDPFTTHTELAVDSARTGVTLDVRTASMAGSVRVNGAVATNPSSCSGSTPKATVTLVGSGQGARYTATLLCSTTSFAYNFPAVLADTYRVVATGLLSPSVATNLPQAPYTADAARVIDAALTGQVLDVKTVSVTGSGGTTGSIRVNGAAAVNGSNCSGTANPTAVKARAHLKGVTHDKDYAWDMLCSSALFTVPATPVLAGEYRMEVEGFADASGVALSNVPVGGLLVTQASRSFTADTTAVRWEVTTFTYSARVRLNGTTTFPANAGSCAGTGTDPKARVRMRGVNVGGDFSASIPCNSTTWVAALGAIPADTYRITVMGVEGRCTLPNEPYVTQEAYIHDANVTTAVNQVVRTALVGGRVYLNGVYPTSGPGTCSGTTPRVALTFTGSLHGAAYGFSVPCSSATYTMPNQTILQDTYRVTVAGLSAGGTPLSSLPAHPFVAHTALSVTADNTTQRFDVSTRSWEGPILSNGTLPTTTCSSPTVKAEVRLTGTLHGQVETDAVRCGEAYRAQFTVFPDTYRVDVRGLGADRTNLPETWVPVTRLRVP
jgi:hypothetical protein